MESSLKPRGSIGLNELSNSQFEQNSRFCWLGLPNPKPFLPDLAIQQSHIEN
jgi:hypothetical protein